MIRVHIEVGSLFPSDPLGANPVGVFLFVNNKMREQPKYELVGGLWHLCNKILI